MGVSLVGPFNIPKNYRPVSAVFWIDINVPLLECVELHIPHFVRLQNEKDTKKLSFFLADDQSFTNTGEFQFDRELDCSFKPGSAYGALWVDHFCVGCLLEDIEESCLPLEYLVTTVLPKDRDRPSWRSYIVFSHAILTCLTVCQHYNLLYSSCAFFSVQ